MRGAGDLVVLETDSAGPQRRREHSASGSIDFRKCAYADALRRGRLSSSAAVARPREMLPLQGRHDPTAVF